MRLRSAALQAVHCLDAVASKRDALASIDSVSHLPAVKPSLLLQCCVSICEALCAWHWRG
jgi:hypothetical protein